jgi:hypothetical protein
MWRTPSGERVLVGAEWALVRAALGGLWDGVEDAADAPDLFEAGVAAFDELQPGQKAALLAAVGRALHDPGVPPSPLTAHGEAAIAAALAFARGELIAEVRLPTED